MNVFMQGMRRSGTTIFFDIFWEDGRFDGYYEPLAAAKRPAYGGGSGVRSVDYFEKVRAIRERFAQEHPDVQNVNYLNYGAPRQYELELESDLPETVRAYIRTILDQLQDTAIKFTRMYCKVKALWEMDPKAKVLHLVRDPRRVTASYLFGKNGRNRHLFHNEDVFFTRKSEYTAWSSYPVSQGVLLMPEYAHLRDCEDYMRILLLWKFTFERTHDVGRALFGKNYRLFRHEDLIADPAGTLRALYDFLRRPLPRHVLAWSKCKVRRAPSQLYAAEDPRWVTAIERLNMTQTLQQAGYEDCLP